MGGVVRSMTGFGRATAPLSPRLTAEVRLAAVNGRFLEVVVRIQPRLESAELEAAIRAVLAEKLARGRVQVSVALQTVERSTGSVTLHWEVAEALLAALAKRPEGLELAPLTLRDLLALPGFAEGGELALADEEQQTLLDLIGRARDALVVAREAEAAALMPQIRAEAARVREFQRWLADANVQVGERLLARLRERLATLLAGAEVPQERVVQEAALAADRADVAEEVTRIGAHLDHLDRLLTAGGPTGKRIDFLLQELLREVNTAGAKCREAGMGERVVEAKAALEKLREQCANLE